jgi:hypothetical protein
MNVLRMHQFSERYTYSGTSYIHAKLWRDWGTSARVAVDLWVFFEKVDGARVWTCLFGMLLAARPLDPISVTRFNSALPAQAGLECESECFSFLPSLPDEVSLLCTRLSAYSRW